MRSGFTQKRCPKCGGNVYLDSDFYGWYEKCFQCGYTRDLETIVEVRQKGDKDSLRRAKESARSK